MVEITNANKGKEVLFNGNEYGYTKGKFEQVLGDKIIVEVVCRVVGDRYGILVPIQNIEKII